MFNNYHTHTYRCKHATGGVSEYVEAAISRNVPILGISDHTPLPWNNWITVRMELSELDAYTKEVEVAQKYYKKDITVLKGMECDHVSEYLPFFKEELLEKRHYEYLIGAVHCYVINGKWRSAFSISTQEEVEAYIDLYCDGMRSGFYDFMAHPDVFLSCLEWTKELECAARRLLEVAAGEGCILEINGNGFLKPEFISKSGTSRISYPVELFWKLASEYDIRVICNSDAHTPDYIIGGIEKAQSIALKYSLDVVSELDVSS
jgi:histidinol-phosphatase (PHP family)